jgi:hypothetical protein
MTVRHFKQIIKKKLKDGNKIGKRVKILLQTQNLIHKLSQEIIILQFVRPVLQKLWQLMESR